MTEAHALAPLDFLTHSKVAIDARPSAVWGAVMEPNGLGGQQQLIHIDGEPGQVGERFHAVDKAAPDTPLFFIENAEVATEQRRTIRLNTLAGGFMGFATWTLTPEGAGTVLTYDVYCHYDGLPAGQEKTAYMDGFQAAMDAGLVRLKGVIEQQAA